MVSTRFLGLVSTVLLVVGALAFGEALHRTVVTNQAPLTSPLMIVYFVVGVVFILLGYRARQPVGQRYALGSDDERERTARPDEAGESGAGSGPDETEFDPEMSPLGDAAPGDSRREDDAERPARTDVGVDAEEAERTERERPNGDGSG